MLPLPPQITLEILRRVPPARLAGFRTPHPPRLHVFKAREISVSPGRPSTQKLLPGTGVQDSCRKSWGPIRPSRDSPCPFDPAADRRGRRGEATCPPPPPPASLCALVVRVMRFCCVPEQTRSLSGEGRRLPSHPQSNGAAKGGMVAGSPLGASCRRRELQPEGKCTPYYLHPGQSASTTTPQHATAYPNSH